MPRTCIICGNRAGSAEHIFPAGLGGRRTNRGIYCGPHNNGFSISILKALVVVTGDDNPTLSAKGQATLIAAATAFVDDLVDRLAVGDIDMDYLWSLFSGGHGGSIVWQIMCDIAQSE
jgi:hypothetical protein